MFVKIEQKKDTLESVPSANYLSVDQWFAAYMSLMEFIKES